MCKAWPSPLPRRRLRGRVTLCQRTSMAVRCGLTPPSSGRSKGRSAPFGPPLMSNVRFREVQIPLPVSQASGVVARAKSKPGSVVPQASALSSSPSKSLANQFGHARRFVHRSIGVGPPVLRRAAHLCGRAEGRAVRVRAGLSVRWRSAHQLVWRANGKTLRFGRAVGGASSGHGCSQPTTGAHLPAMEHLAQKAMQSRFSSGCGPLLACHARQSNPSIERTF